MRIFLLRMLAFILVAATDLTHAKVLVLSSIKPLTLIAQEIVGDSGSVDTLLPVTASPHDYPLKASDHSRLQKADIVLWVGPELESFLQKPLGSLPSARLISGYGLAGLYWPAEEVGHDHHHERDPHLWLDPRNAIVVARRLSEKLIEIDVAHKQNYSSNLQVFVKKMEALDAKIAIKLRPFAGIGFAVYHEGYRHFVGRYGLRQLDYVTFTPEQQPGAKHLQSLREVLRSDGVCLFLEPYFEPPSVRNLAKELNLHLGILDALGTQNVTSYQELLERMADAFSTCLANRPA